MSTDRQYPIGKYIRPTQFDAAALQQHIQTISDFPTDIQKLADALTPMQLNMSYRPGGWTSRQVIHHCADSHMNSFIRFKLALTEDNPAIKPYMEAAWAEMADYQQASITESLQIIHGLHARWTILLRNMQEADFHKTVFHPQQDRTIPLYALTALYAWHCKHHLAHINLVLNS